MTTLIHSPHINPPVSLEKRDEILAVKNEAWDERFKDKPEYFRKTLTFDNGIINLYGLIMDSLCQTVDNCWIEGDGQWRLLCSLSNDCPSWIVRDNKIIELTEDQWYKNIDIGYSSGV